MNRYHGMRVDFFHRRQDMDILYAPEWITEVVRLVSKETGRPEDDLWTDLATFLENHPGPGVSPDDVAKALGCERLDPGE